MGDEPTREIPGRILGVDHGTVRIGLAWSDPLLISAHPGDVLVSQGLDKDLERVRAVCEEKQIRQSFTRPYTPRTNGKAERFIQTLKRRWAYRYTYRTSAIRAASLRPWLTHYNHQRPHRALGKNTPMARLRAAREQRA